MKINRVVLPGSAGRVDIPAAPDRKATKACADHKDIPARLVQKAQEGQKGIKVTKGRREILAAPDRRVRKGRQGRRVRWVLRVSGEMLDRRGIPDALGRKVKKEIPGRWGRKEFLGR